VHSKETLVNLTTILLPLLLVLVGLYLLKRKRRLGADAE
jgi:LPXTG-motif cell wall-anchored protein